MFQFHNVLKTLIPKITVVSLRRIHFFGCLAMKSKRAYNAASSSEQNGILFKLSLLIVEQKVY